MKRLVMRVVGLYLVPLTLCSAAVASSRSPSVMTLLRQNGLDTCDSRPCLFGVTPGKTLWRDAEELLAERARIASESQWISVELDRHTRAVIPRYKADATISDILISFYDSASPSVGSLVAQYGPPCLVLYNRSSRGVVLRYPFMFATTFLASDAAGRDSGSIEQHSSLSTLILHSDLDTCRPTVTLPTGVLVYTPWLGFATLEHYVARQQD